MKQRKQRKLRKNFTIDPDVDHLLKLQSETMGLSVSSYIALMTKFVDRNGIERLVAAS